LNARDILLYGHHTVHGSVEGLVDGDAWEKPGATTAWSIKDVIAHLTSFEGVLAEVLAVHLDPATPTPLLERFGGDKRFSADEVERRRSATPAEVLAEYDATHAEVARLIERIPPEELRRPGTIPWYGPEYALDDLIVYAFYGHKREHAAQIKQQRRRLGA
jgi:hypothetical protein